MLNCPKCGAVNEFGRVFCAQCGAKMDMSAVSADQIARAGAPRLVKKHWPKLLWLAGIAVVVMVALAFWPATGPIGEIGPRPAGKALAERLSVLNRLGRGRSLGVTVPEAALNSFIEFFRRPDLGFTSYTVSLEAGRLRARIVKRLAGLRLYGWEIEPTVSWELEAVPVGGVLHVASARMGHLRAHGPLRAHVVRRFLATIVDDPDWQRWTEDVESIEIEDDELTFTVAR